MPREDLKARINKIEEAYEFMLSYAARGLESDETTQLRIYLEGANEALAGLADAARAAAASGDGTGAENPEAVAKANAFAEVLDRDAAAAKAAVELALAQDGISSQLVDNLNASIHIRALLTDLFLIDEALRLGVGAESPPAAFAPDENEQFGPEEGEPGFGPE